MYQITSFAFNRFETMLNSALQMTQDERVCAACAEDNPMMVRVIQGVPVRVCNQGCAVKLVDLWRTGPKVLKYNHLARMFRLTLDKVFGF